MAANSTSAACGSGELSVKRASSSGSIRTPSSPDRGRRRRCARWTGSPRLTPALATGSCVGERRLLSEEKGKARRRRETKQRWGKVREGAEGVSVAPFGGLGRPGTSWASRWRPRRRRRATELLGSAGWKTTGEFGWAGPSREVGPRLVREVSFSDFCLIFPFCFSVYLFWF